MNRKGLSAVVFVYKRNGERDSYGLAGEGTDEQKRFRINQVQEIVTAMKRVGINVVLDVATEIALKNLVDGGEKK